jgi:hypothetical protein
MPKAGPVLQAARMGESDRMMRQKRGALSQAGQFAAQGDLGKARDHLYGQGHFDEGTQIQQLMQQADATQLAKAQKRSEMLGNLAMLADTPEKWQQAVEVLKSRGQDVSNYEDFSARDIAIAEAGKATDMLKLEMARRKAQGFDPDQLSPEQQLEWIRRKKAAEKQGTVEGEQEAEKPKTVAKGERMLASIDAALKDPGTFVATGPIGGLLPNVFPAATRGQSRIDQIQGQTFLQAYQDLKGAGQITEVEGKKGEAALSRLANQSMSDEDYRQALLDLRDVVEKGLARARGEDVKGDDMPKPSSPEEAAKLPSGTRFMTPDGRIKVRP